MKSCVRLVACLIVLAVCQATAQDVTDSEAVLVLFLGNSYTFGNDMPGMFASLARAAGHEVGVDMVARGGMSLVGHEDDLDVRDKIRDGGWHYVVLQDQSVAPALPDRREKTMYPAARSLHKFIFDAEAETVFFMTWGRQRGLASVGFADFDSMQDEIRKAYVEISRELGAGLAPVGEAWRLAMKENPDLNLFEPDGSHPNERGSYLAACVIYATIFAESPEGNEFVAGLDDAAVLQGVAARVVLR